MSDPHYRSEDASCTTASWRPGHMPSAIGRTASKQAPAAGRIAACCRMSTSTGRCPTPATGRCCRGSADFLWGDLRPRAMQPDAEALELRAALTAALGERLAAAYIGEDEAGAEAIRASIEASPRPDDASIRIDTARAA